MACSSTLCGLIVKYKYSYSTGSYSKCSHCITYFIVAKLCRVVEQRSSCIISPEITKRISERFSLINSVDDFRLINLILGLKKNKNKKKNRGDLETKIMTSWKQGDSRHVKTSDVRSQLRFLGEVESLRKKRQDDEERERLLRLAKVSLKPEIH